MSKVGASTEDQGKIGATASFPYDRTTVDRFRQAFPRARWRDDRRAWFVPGKRAEQRIERWLGRVLAGLPTYEDERGRDAFAFDPIESIYLEAGGDLLVRTPYSRTVVAELRAIPWARWDEEERAWHVPYRSFDELRRRWPTIETAARRNEPDERRRRRDARQASLAGEEDRARAREARKRRYPVPADALPPLLRPVMTSRGAVVFTDVSGECVDSKTVERFYAGLDMCDLVWATWRSPTLAELVATWPSRTEPSAREQARGWWQPTLDQLREERRKARSLERRRARKTREAASGRTVETGSDDRARQQADEVRKL